MYFKKSMEDVLNGLKVDKLELELCKQAWENVSVLRKKDGSEYAQLGRAIKGASLDSGYSTAADNLHPYLTVYYRNGAKYLNDSIAIFWYLDELPEADPRRSAYRRQFVRQTTPMTAEEVRQLISKRIADKENSIREYDHDISVCEKAYAAFREKMHEAEEELRSAGSRHLFYEVRDAMTM